MEYIELITLFTQGMIGGWNISSTSLSGTNGGTTIEMNVTDIDPFFQVTAINGSFTRINYQGLKTTYTVTDDILVNRAIFINAEHVFVKSGIGSNGEDQYSGRVGDYGSNGFAFIERKGLTGQNVEVNAYAVYAAFGSVSDIRYKKNITVSPYGLREILQLNPIRYQYNLPEGHPQRSDESVHVGLSAQEVSGIIPEATHQIQDQDMLAITLADMVPVLINAIKELNIKCENLTKDLEIIKGDS